FLAGTADSGVAAGEGDPGSGDCGRADGGGAVAEPSVHPGGDSRMWLSAGGPKRQSGEPGFAYQCRARAQIFRLPNPTNCGWRAITNRHRIHGAGPFSLAAAPVAARDDPCGVVAGRNARIDTRLRRERGGPKKSRVVAKTLCAESQAGDLDLEG